MIEWIFVLVLCADWEGWDQATDGVERCRPQLAFNTEEQCRDAKAYFESLPRAAKLDERFSCESVWLNREGLTAEDWKRYGYR